MAYRLVRVCCWAGRPISSVKSKGSKVGGAAVSFLKALLIWPFIPWVKNTFNRNPLIYLAGGLFHLGLFVVLILGTAHMLVWKSLLGFGWPTLPLPIVDWLAAGAIVAMIVLFINRLVQPSAEADHRSGRVAQSALCLPAHGHRLHHDASPVLPV